MDESSFFDNLAPSWDDNEVLSTPERINHILDCMEIEPDQQILDLGTGTGVLIPYLSDRIKENGKIKAIDYSEGMLRRAVEKFSQICPKPEFLKLDFETENIDGEFDRIILYCVYPHLHTPADTLKWLLKVNLKDNGAIYIAFPCGPDFINNIHREKHSESDVLPSPSELVEFLKNNGINAEVIKDESHAYVVKIKK